MAYMWRAKNPGDGAAQHPEGDREGTSRSKIQVGVMRITGGAGEQGASRVSNKRKPDAEGDGRVSSSRRTDEGSTSTSHPPPSTLPITQPARAPVNPAYDQLLPSKSTNRLTFPTHYGPQYRSVITWNVCGLESCNTPAKDSPFRRYIEHEDPDIVCLTESKTRGDAPNNTFDFLKPRYPHRYYQYETAVLTKYCPLSVVYGFPQGTRYDREDAKSRCITLEFPTMFICTTYVKNSGDSFKNIRIRQAWDADFAVHLRSLDALKPVIWTGDFNVVFPYPPGHKEGLLRSPDLERNSEVFGSRQPGTHPSEIAAHRALLFPPDLQNPSRPGLGFVDIWRLMKGPDVKEYTHTSKKFSGWRLDGFILSERIKWRVRRCEIRHEVQEVFGSKSLGGRGSDHWPVWLQITGEL